MRSGKTSFLLVFLGAPLALFGILVLWPYVNAFYYALTDWSGYTPNFSFVGLQNFTYLFGIGVAPDTAFWAGLRNNLILLLVVPTITLVIALVFASLLSLSGNTRSGQIRGVAGSPFYQALFFIPQVISVAALGIMFQQVFQPNGLLNSMLRLIGLEPPSWLADPSTAMVTVVIVMVWSNVGFYLVYFTAAMTSIPRELYEAASIDMASPFQTFLRVTLPLLAPAVTVAAIYLGIQCLDVFAIVQLMTIGPGGPNDTTTVMALSIYKNFKEQGLFGYSSAQSVVLFLVTIVLAALTLRMSKRDQVEL